MRQVNPTKEWNKEIKKQIECVHERDKPEMESTNFPLMNSFVNFMVGILTNESELPLL